MKVLVVNAGSSSLKLRLLDPADGLAQWAEDLPAVDELGEEGLAAALDEVADAVDAVGHRVVHGGPDLTRPTRLDDAVVRRLHELTTLAPLHQPAALAGIDAVGKVLPDRPAIACFDTAFHATLAPAAVTYPLPAIWRDRYGLRRYGFHGLSHAHAARRAVELVPGASRVISCHLGAGASLTAILDGRSIDTTMGFTPLEGVMMATRSGSVDPGLLLWLLAEGRLDATELTDGLNHRAGLLGLAGDKDMKAVLARTDAEATLAVEVYLHRLRASIAAMAAALDGIDVLLFTGGIGERAPAIRAGAADGLGFLGVAVDAERNAAATGDVDISAAGAPVRTLVVAAREDLEIARGVRDALS
jgi:acetate kinase